MVPCRNRLASTENFAIISSRILGGLLSGGFLTGYLIKEPVIFFCFYMPLKWLAIRPRDWTIFESFLHEAFESFHEAALSQVRICRAPPPSSNQKWSNFREICAMCWSEWKINFPIFAIFSPWDMVVQNATIWLTKIIPKDAQCSETEVLVREFFFMIFSSWDMIDFVLKFVVYWSVGLRRIQTFFYVMAGSDSRSRMLLDCGLV